MLGLFAFFYGSCICSSSSSPDRLCQPRISSLLVWQNIRELAASIGGEIYKRPYITVGFTSWVLHARAGRYVDERHEAPDGRKALAGVASG